MPTTLAITNIGSKYKVVINSSTQPIYTSSPMKLSYNTVNNTVDVGFVTEDNSPCYYTGIAIANLSLGGVVITNQTVFETQVASVFINAGSAAIPTRADSLVLLTGEIIFSGGNYYFVDRSGNARNFLITGCDFDANWTRGFPYKSAATISAPAGDATLIAADLNSFLYTAGTPNQIPVVSLFQDIDYEHKMFSLHQAQQVDNNGVEILEPRVMIFVVYNTVKTGSDLTACQTYFGVPTELNSTQAVWISGIGNDTTGTGTKGNPWRSFSKIRLETKSVYVKSGAYTSTANVTYTGATPINIIGVGMAVINMVTYNFRWQRIGSTVSGLIEDNTNVGATFNSQYFDYSVTFNRCKFGKSGAGQSWAYIYPTAAYLNLNNCILRNTGTSAGFFACSNNIPQIKLNGCYGSLGVGYSVQFIITNYILTYNKFTQYTTATLVTSTNANIFNNKVTGNFTLLKADSYLVKWNTVIDGCLSLSESNNAAIMYNFVNASLSNKLTEKPAFLVTTNSGSTYTGGEIYYNQFIGAAITGVIAQVNQRSNCKIYYNYFKNEYIGTGTGHTLFCNGVDFDIRWNEFIMSNGHGIVMKSAGFPNLDLTRQIAYNIFKCTGFSLNVIWVRGALGIIFANNTAVNYSGTRIYALDDNAQGYANSLHCVNNVISLGGNTADYTNSDPYATNITFSKNLLNANGYSSPSNLRGDLLTTVAISVNGTPASRLDNGDTLSGAVSDIGLGTAYSIPFNPVQKQQNGLWQQGAIIL